MSRALRTKRALSLWFVDPADAAGLASWVTMTGTTPVQWQPQSQAFQLATSWATPVAPSQAVPIGGAWQFGWPLVVLQPASYDTGQPTVGPSRAILIRRDAMVNDTYDTISQLRLPHTELQTETGASLPAGGANAQPGAAMLGVLDGSAGLVALTGSLGQWAVWLASPMFWAEWLAAQLQSAIHVAPKIATHVK
jgi:hypothetical protein